MKINRKALFWITSVFILAVVAVWGMHTESLYAKNLQVEGKVININWKSNNHALPQFYIQDNSGNIITISHSTISLDESDIRVGDYILKYSDSEFCLINDKKVKFSRDPGEFLIFKIF